MSSKLLYKYFDIIIKGSIYLKKIEIFHHPSEQKREHINKIRILQDGEEFKSCRHK